ncbi:MAG TPA: hypothetical protein VKU80_13890, partial [Planctomycetota bacterium]|nr:hypothetical protein [Planctomycetota bacterium]
MRSTILALVLLVPAAGQDAPDLLRSCEALYDPLTSLLPDVRTKAHAELVKLTVNKREYLKTPVLPSPQIALALLGETAAGKEVAKILAEEPGPLTRIAVEALGHV